ncbi:hypothetical protein BsWGS_28566 [Bradybaena similaris]
MTRPLHSNTDSPVPAVPSDHGSSIRNKIYVNFNQPEGTIHRMTFTVDPQMIVALFKADLTHVINIPAEFVKLSHRNKVLDDDKMLQEQGVQHKDFIVLTDSRLNYVVLTHNGS